MFASPTKHARQNINIEPGRVASMANPYLIQAIYGPKPTPSRVNDNSANDEPSNSERSNREPSTPKLDAGNSRNNHALATSNTSTLSGGSFLKPGDSIPTTSRPMSLAERLYGSTVESNPGIWDRVSPRGSKGDAASGISALHYKSAQSCADLP